MTSMWPQGAGSKAWAAVLSAAVIGAFVWLWDANRSAGSTTLRIERLESDATEAERRYEDERRARQSEARELYRLLYALRERVGLLERAAVDQERRRRR